MRPVTCNSTLNQAKRSLTRATIWLTCNRHSPLLVKIVVVLDVLSVMMIQCAPRIISKSVTDGTSRGDSRVNLAFVCGS